MNSGWGQFIARSAVRKVVYVLVGLALAAVFAVTGVKAHSAAIASASSIFASPTYVAANAYDGSVTSSWASNAGGDIGDWLQLDFGETSVASVSLLGRGLVAAGTVTTSDSQSVNVPSPSASGWTVVDLADSAITWIRFTFTADASGDPGFAEVMINPVSGGGSTALSAEDRTLFAYGFGLTVFLLTAIAVVVGLRR